MQRVLRMLVPLLGLGLALLFTSCGISEYPGQPGRVTNNYSKIDMEYLDSSDGLYVYEVSYDNTPNGKGVGAITTKRYPHAKTYTSNVRMNADGTVYRAKNQYQGARVEAIVIPSLNQIMMPPDSTVGIFIGYVTSLDETDDRNIAEEGLFTSASGVKGILSNAARAYRKFRFDILKAGQLDRNGNLAYEVTGLEIEGKKFTPSEPVKVETNFLQNAVHSKLDKKLVGDLRTFFEGNFPKGYKGLVNFTLKGVKEPLKLQLSLNTVKTAETAGMKVIKNANADQLQSALERYNQN